jgi:hypothetical protein
MAAKIQDGRHIKIFRMLKFSAVVVITEQYEVTPIYDFCIT